MPTLSITIDGQPQPVDGGGKTDPTIINTAARAARLPFWGGGRRRDGDGGWEADGGWGDIERKSTSL